MKDEEQLSSSGNWIDGGGNMYDPNGELLYYNRPQTDWSETSNNDSKPGPMFYFFVVLSLVILFVSIAIPALIATLK